MMFKRKIYNKLEEWKEKYSGSYACMVEGARRVGKSTVTEEFARNEYKTYIRIDFSKITDEMLDVFRDIANPDIFFLRLQEAARTRLYERQSVIIFDEVQLYPKARQAIKHLVKDGRYDYIETGSLISIKKNVKKIVIPSEEHKIQMYPMDYEEFLWATNGNPDILNEIYHSSLALGNATNRSAMRDFRIYMAIGGMPQAVETYLSTNNFDEVDRVKREIIQLYMDDFAKIDPSGRLANIYKGIPSQLALGKKNFVISHATGKQKTAKDEERIFEMLNSKTALACYNVTQPGISLSQTKDFDTYKLYLSDTGLFTTMLFDNRKGQAADIYQKLLSDKLEADLGYLYENAAAQMITADDRELYYHTWEKDKGGKYYEIDFLISSKNKVIPIEVKSSGIKKHVSLDRFIEKYSNVIGPQYLLSQKDVSHDGTIQYKPIYMLPFLLKDL